MRRQSSSTLLRGALHAIALFSVAAILSASPSARAAAPAQDSTAAPSLEVAFSWNATRSNPISGSSFWMQGGSFEVHGQFYRGLGAVADIAGAHTAGINSSGVGLDMVTATFGPRYTWSLRNHKFRFFGQGLAGVANGFNSVFPSPNGANTSATSLALKAGGGMNISLTPHIALRAVQANWLRTAFPNSTTSAQNNLVLGAGIVIRLR